MVFWYCNSLELKNKITKNASTLAHSFLWPPNLLATAIRSNLWWWLLLVPWSPKPHQPCIPLRKWTKDHISRHCKATIISSHTLMSSMACLVNEKSWITRESVSPNIFHQQCEDDSFLCFPISIHIIFPPTIFIIFLNTFHAYQTIEITKLEYSFKCFCFHPWFILGEFTFASLITLLSRKSYHHTRL